MSTKGTHIPDWLQVPFAGITPAPSQQKGQDLFPTGNWRAIRPVYRDKMPPCNNACGTNEKIQGYLDLVKRGKYLDAYALIKEDMPFPSVTGRVCYHPCEQACNRGQYDEAISIRAVERFLGDLGQALKKDVVSRGTAERQKGGRRRVGTGGPQRRVPARAPWLHRHHPGAVAEGRRAESRRHSRLGAAAGRARSRNRAARRSRHRRSRPTPKSAKTSRWDDLKRNYDAVVLAVGLIDPNSARAEGEDKDGVLFGLPFLRDIGMGTSKVKLGAARRGDRRRQHRHRLRPRSAATGRRRSDDDHGRGRTSEMPAVPEDLHDMLEEGVELMHGLAMTAVLGNGKVEALELHPARFSGAINASPIAIDRDATVDQFRGRQRDHRRRTARLARVAAGRIQDRARHDQGRSVRASRRHQCSSPPATSSSSDRASR